MFAALLNVRDIEIAELKSKIAEVMACMPANYPNIACAATSVASAGLPTPHFSEAFACSTPPPPPPTVVTAAAPGGLGAHGDDPAAAAAAVAAATAATSSLNPNASDYTPKV